MFDELKLLMTERYPAQFRLLIEGGKLDGEWANVARHCLIQAMAAEVLADLLGLDEPTKRKLASVAVAHDWRKRWELRPNDFSVDDRVRAEQLGLQAALDDVLMAALTPPFLLRVQEGKATFLEKVQYYLDGITKNDEIVPFYQRVADAELRNPNPDPVVTTELNRPYWDVEREVGHQIEDMLLEILKSRRVSVASARQIPELILAEIRRRIALPA